MHVFRSPQLTIKLPGGVQYTAVPQTVGAPLRTVTVKDAIGDLPQIANGANRTEMPYDGTLISHCGADKLTISGSDLDVQYRCIVIHTWNALLNTNSHIFGCMIPGSVIDFIK